MHLFRRTSGINLKNISAYFVTESDRFGSLRVAFHFSSVDFFARHPRNYRLSTVSEISKPYRVRFRVVVVV